MSAAAPLAYLLAIVRPAVGQTVSYWGMLVQNGNSLCLQTSGGSGNPPVFQGCSAYNASSNGAALGAWAIRSDSTLYNLGSGLCLYDRDGYGNNNTVTAATCPGSASNLWTWNTASRVNSQGSLIPGGTSSYCLDSNGNGKGGSPYMWSW